MFHLVTHAAFKALLFLASGSVIHGSGTQDLHEMGGLRSSMPVTAIVWIIGGLALAGIPPTAGFFAKDEVVASVLHGAPWAGVMLMLASLLTGAYIARATRLAFFGSPRGTSKAHESPWVMTVPLAILAAGALTIGFLGSSIAGVLGVEPEALSLGFAALAVGIAVIGLASGWLFAGDAGRAESSLSPALRGVWDTLQNGYGFDGLVTRAVVAPVVAGSQVVDSAIDRTAIDGAAEGVAGLSRRFGILLADTMNGKGQSYSALLATGVILLISLTIWLVR